MNNQKTRGNVCVNNTYTKGSHLQHTLRTNPLLPLSSSPLHGYKCREVGFLILRLLIGCHSSHVIRSSWWEVNIRSCLWQLIDSAVSVLSAQKIGFPWTRMCGSSGIKAQLRHICIQEQVKQNNDQVVLKTWLPYCKHEHLWCWLYNDSRSHIAF